PAGHRPAGRGGAVAILNITYAGRSADVAEPVPDRTSDAEIKRVAVEVLRAGDVPGLRVPGLSHDAFRHFVVDRFTDQYGEVRIYLRPKVPFGAGGPAGTAAR